MSYIPLSLYGADISQVKQKLRGAGLAKHNKKQRFVLFCCFTLCGYDLTGLGSSGCGWFVAI